MPAPTLPLVSVVIPLYNQQPDFFQAALSGALDQTYANVEVLVSDNHSTNEVPAFLSTFRHPRLRVVKPPTFLPMVQHFQYAADQAAGDYISFLCSDDWLYPEAIETVMTPLLAHPDAVAAYGEIENVDHQDISRVRLYTNRRPTGLRTAAESLNELLQARPFFAWIPGGVMKKSGYTSVRHLLNGSLTFAFDVALLFKLHESGSIAYVDKPLAKFRVWTAKDGKLGGARLLENIADIGQVCTMLEQSPRLLAMLTHGQQDVTGWRAYQAKRWVMALLVGLVTGTISPDVCREGVEAIRRHLAPNPAGAKALLLLLKKPIYTFTTPVLANAYRGYLWMQYRIKKAF